MHTISHLHIHNYINAVKILHIFKLRIFIREFIKKNEKLYKTNTTALFNNMRRQPQN
jgi:hypothetical protein